MFSLELKIIWSVKACAYSQEEKSSFYAQAESPFMPPSQCAKELAVTWLKQDCREILPNFNE